MASSLDRWLSTLSRGTLATLAIGGGILFIVLSDPPRNQCDAQFDYVKQQQAGFLFASEDKSVAKGVSYKQLKEYCEKSPGPGACYEFFGKLRIMIRDLQTIPDECAGRAGGINEIKEAVWGAAKFMVNSAWGEKPPDNYMERFGWLDQADVALYCSLNAQIVRMYGQGAWDSYRETLFSELPGAKDLPRKEAWPRMLLSEDCRRYQ